MPGEKQPDRLTAFEVTYAQLRGYISTRRATAVHVEPQESSVQGLGWVKEKDDVFEVVGRLNIRVQSPTIAFDHRSRCHSAVSLVPAGRNRLAHRSQCLLIIAHCLSEVLTARCQVAELLQQVSLLQAQVARR